MGKKWDSKRLLILIPLIFMSFFFLWPILKIIQISFAGEKFIDLTFLLDVFKTPLYLKVILNTLWISFLVTLNTLIIGVPIAYLLFQSEGLKFRLVFTIVIMSLWLSILIRSYAWTLILQREGLLSNLLYHLNIISQPQSFMFSKFAVVLGMTHILLPYMIFIIWAVLHSDIKWFSKVAYSFGASKTIFLFKVFFPLSRNAILSGSILVYLLSVGFFITPALLGGGNSGTIMISMLIEEQVNTFANWQMGSAISFLLLVIVFFILGIFLSIKKFRINLYNLFYGHASK